MYVDGMSVGDVHTGVLRDRKRLSRDGIVTIVVAIGAHDGTAATVPEVIIRGAAYATDEELLKAARNRVSKVLRRTASEGATDHHVVMKAVRDSVSQLIWEKTRTRPMVIPVVLEV